MSDLSEFIQSTYAYEIGGEYNWRVYVAHETSAMPDMFDVQATSEFDAKESCYLHIQGLKGELI